MSFDIWTGELKYGAGTAVECKATVSLFGWDAKNMNIQGLPVTLSATLPVISVHMNLGESVELKDFGLFPEIAGTLFVDLGTLATEVAAEEGEEIALSELLELGAPAFEIILPVIAVTIVAYVVAAAIAEAESIGDCVDTANGYAVDYGHGYRFALDDEQAGFLYQGAFSDGRFAGAFAKQQMFDDFVKANAKVQQWFEKWAKDPAKRGKAIEAAWRKYLASPEGKGARDQGEAGARQHALQVAPRSLRPVWS